MKVKKGYEQVAEILTLALDQAQHGKGHERHAEGLPFEEQRMLSISRAQGDDGGLAYQIQKKVQECRGFDNLDAIERELYGAIIYVAGMVIFHREKFSKKKPSSSLESGHFAVQIPETSNEKIDYEITVDIRGLSVEDKKKAQDAYFKLGIEWQNGGKLYLPLDRYWCKFLTNRFAIGGLTNRMMTVNNDREPTHTFQQLLELAGVDK